MTQSATPETAPVRSRFPELGYILGWGVMAGLIGYVTYAVVASNPAVAPPDRAKVESDDPVGTALIATEVRVQSLDPDTSAVRWQLRVPKTAGGIESTTTFDDPTIVLYPATRNFVITAARGTLEQAPSGEMHQAGNVRLTLAGPIEGRNADGSEHFTADSAFWNGLTEQLELTGSPLLVERSGLRLSAQRLVVTFVADGTAKYDLTGGVEIQGPGQ